MMADEPRGELVVLSPDKQTEAALSALLSRTKSLGIRDFRTQPKIYVHIENDPGVLRGGVDFLKIFSKRYEHGLIVFDRHGCGQDQKPALALEDQIRRRLQRSAWLQRADVVVLDPELEVWVWSDSPEVERCLGWLGHRPSLRDWLMEKFAWEFGRGKPGDPQAVLQAALKEVRKRRTSAVFRQLAESVSLRRCTDPAFGRLCEILRRWFPARQIP